MSAKIPAQAAASAPLGDDISGTSKEDGKQPENDFLTLTNGIEPTEEEPKNCNVKRPSDGPRDAHAGKDVAPTSGKTGQVKVEPSIGAKQQAVTVVEPELSVQGGRDRAGTSSSIWSTATTTLKNLVIGKPQPVPSGIVTVVPAPGARASSEQGNVSQASRITVDKGKGNAVPPDDSVVPLNDSGNASSMTSAPEGKAKPQAQPRPSAPPPRLSSIAHSLPTSHATVPSPPPPPASSTSPSIQSPESATSNATATSATTATDEENQAAALAALNAVIHSVGTGYTQPLTSRAAQLHANDLMLAQQREKLLRETSLLAKDAAALQKLALESNNKLKSFGDLKNWTETLDNDLSAIEETLRIVDRGSLELCAKCEEGISEEEPQRWCGVCGKGFHELCAPPDPEEDDGPRMPGLGDDYQEEECFAEDAADQGRAAHPHELPLPPSLPDTVTSRQPPHAEAAMGSTPPSIPFSQPSVPKPSSMFEWGGIPDAIKDIAALRGHHDSGSESGSGSEWSGEDWRCRECRLKADLDDIVGGL